MREFTIFLKYLVTPSGFLKDIFIGMKDLFVPKRLSIIFIFIAVISSILLPYNKKIVAGGFLFLALYMQFRIIYKSGEHNRWRKERLIIRSGVKNGVGTLSNPLPGVQRSQMKKGYSLREVPQEADNQKEVDNGRDTGITKEDK